MFGKYVYHKALSRLKRNTLSDTANIIWPNKETTAKAKAILKGLVALKKYTPLLDERGKELFDQALVFITKINNPSPNKRSEELKNITAKSLNKSIQAIYEAFHSSEIKKKQIAEEIKRRLEFYNVDPHIEVSSSHRPGKGEALAKVDLERLSKKKLLLYFHGTEHPSRSWYHIGGFFRTAYKAGLIEITKSMPPKIKTAILRMIGVYIGENVSIGKNVQFDYFYPELIRIEDGVVIQDNAKLWTHDFSAKKFAFASLVLHSRVVIGDNCIIGPVEIGEGVQVKPGSVVLRNLPERIRVYDNADPEYQRFLAEAIGGRRYEKLKHKFLDWILRFCKILPYDPVPRDIPFVGMLPLINKLPAINFKNKVHKLLGIKIRGHITTAPRVYIDAIHPELVEIGDGALIGDGVIFRPYDINGKPTRIVIGQNCKIGSETIVLGCTIGNNSQVNVRSVVIGNIPSNVTVGGVFAKVLSKNHAR